MKGTLSGSMFTMAIALTLGCSRSSSPPPPNPALASLQAALDGHPDAATRAATKTLAGTLNAEDWGYLTYAQWPADDGSAALTDPTLQKAAKALAAAGGILLASPGTVSAKPVPFSGGPHILSGGGPASSDRPWLSLYPDAVELMKDKHGLAYAGAPDVAAAYATLLINAVSAGDSPLPNPTQAADGQLSGCGKSFYDGQTLSALCSPMDFCCKGVIEFGDAGATTICSDYTECRGNPPPPMLDEVDLGAEDDSSDGGSGGSSGGANPCFVGAGVAVMPGPWMQACDDLDPMAPNPITCLDEGNGIPAPTLSDGRDPAEVCKVFTNEDGMGTPLGMTSGCNHEEGPVTCYCCPN